MHSTDTTATNTMQDLHSETCETHKKKKSKKKTEVNDKKKLL